MLAGWWDVEVDVKTYSFTSVRLPGRTCEKKTD